MFKVFHCRITHFSENLETASYPKHVSKLGNIYTGNTVLRDNVSRNYLQ